MNVVPRTSQPGVSRANAVAGRAARASPEVACTILSQAGLPACFWSWAALRGTSLSNLDPANRRMMAGEEHEGELPYEMASRAFPRTDHPLPLQSLSPRR
eukprot:14535835-Alexandrium_andersonii.AAC.1